MYIDDYKSCYHLVLAGFIVDYKEQVLLLALK